MNIHSTCARSIAAVAVTVATFGIAGCGTEGAPAEAPAQDIGGFAPGADSGQAGTSADAAERSGSQDDGWNPGEHKQPADHS
jgi:hypothetical protein